MIYMPSSSWAAIAPLAVYAPGDLSLPDWTFAAWIAYRRGVAAGPRPSLTRLVDNPVERRRRARMLREIVPQDEAVEAA